MDATAACKEKAKQTKAEAKKRKANEDMASQEDWKSAKDRSYWGHDS